MNQTFRKTLKVFLSAALKQQILKQREHPWVLFYYYHLLFSFTSE